MADLQETAARHANDVIGNNTAALMGDFTPAGMMKAMAMVTNPITAQSFEIKDLGNNEVEITYVGAVRRPIWTKWEQTGEKWQIADLAERPA
jgi:hypothetical protein